MKKYSLLLVVLILSILNAQTERVFVLKTGEQVTGYITATDSINNTITVKTSFGSVVIDRGQLKSEVVNIYLKNGDKIKGVIVYEDEKSLRILSQMGEITLEKQAITRIDSGPDNPLDSIMGASKRYSHGMEQQIDIFYDPTGYTLERGVLYISGLSWGFGVTDRFQVTSKWSGYFTGDFNLRPKLQIFKAGNWEKEHTLAIGGHYHSRYVPDKFEWLEENYLVDVGSYSSDDYEWVPTGRDTNVYYGEYVRIGSALNFTDGFKRYDLEYDEVDAWVDIADPDYQGYYEAFVAYSYSKARGKMSGRVNHTLGAIASKFDASDDIMYRIYYGGAIDIRKNLIMNYEIFYDPWYVEWWNRGDYLFDFEQDLETDKPKKPWVSPIHYDLGFIYSFSDWLRFGIHFQPYIFAIYLKF